MLNEMGHGGPVDTATSDAGSRAVKSWPGAYGA